MNQTAGSHSPLSSDACVVVTGGAGFIGCNLADRLAADGHRVRIVDALLRPGVEQNVRWLRARHPDRIEHSATRIEDRPALTKALDKAAAVFHLAAQVAVTSSLDDPDTDFATNVVGTLNILETLRRAPTAVPMIFASTNKVYGDLGGLAVQIQDDRWTPTDQRVADSGIDERWPIAFHTPYGCSKGAADQYVLDYARSFGLPATVLRMSCIFGARQLGTEDQGWVAHFALRALSGEPITIYGDGRQVRDVLDVGDAVDCYIAAWRNIDSVAGRPLNLGGGPENAVSLLQVIAALEQLIGRTIEVRFADWRASDQRYFVTDARRVRADLGLAPPRPWRDGLRNLLGLLSDRHPNEQRAAGTVWAAPAGGVAR